MRYTRRMFRQPPPGPQPPWKRPVYLTLSAVLGILISYGFHVLIELWWLWRTLPSDLVWRSHFGLGSCALAAWLDYSLLLSGTVGGLVIGRMWWRWVYIERRWWRTEKPELRG